MAAFSFSHHSLLITMHHDHRPPLLQPRPRCSLSCRSCHPTEPAGGGGTRSSEKEDQKRKEEKRSTSSSYWWRQLGREFSEAAGKMGKGVKESLSPKQKGDWKDLLLMSFSFAVYVYISQKIVCAYCAWMAMLNNY
ncbi:uncharacterized protein LOC109704546 isoform X2 [Ananas comosus]|uniref:Uncharacterized protein LOC109704546 isoform X2 n=1 Tax=Ananas comosus TaxID=4615 RepID=A0A6P5ECH7_ANACO|nr:uncharacterized protein LOC109704546 isoform X2 [Ananas comosus]